MESIVEFLAHRFTRWQILTLGVITTLAGIVAVTVVAHLCYITFPDAWGWVAAGQLIVGGLLAWYTSGVFADAYVFRGWVEQIVANLKANYPPFDVFDDEPEDAK